MRRAPIALYLALSAWSVVACARRDAGGPEATAAPGSAPRAEAPKATDPGPTFRPPTDGRLTTGPVERFIAIRKRASELASGAPVASGLPTAAALAQLATADLRAARELGYDPDEARWVRDRVAEALGAKSPRGFGFVAALDGLAAAAVASLEARRAESEDAAERARLGQEIARIRADLERRRHASGPATDQAAGSALEDNRRLLEPLRAELVPLVGLAAATLPEIEATPKPAR